MARVEYQLEQLGLAATYVQRDGVAYRRLPEELGWCQAIYAPEEAWPPGAQVCVIVRWQPDAAFRRNSSTGLPDGAEAHWKDRVQATVEGLRAAGYSAAVPGPPRSPQLHAQEDILVWLPDPQQDTQWPPFGAWDDAPPARPNWDQPDYQWPERDPVRTVNEAVYAPRRERHLAGEPQEGHVLTVSAHAVLWPPHAVLCARVLWQPDEEFERRPDGTVPAGAVDHWNAGTARVRRDLEEAGYLVRQAERPTGPDLDDDAGFLVWKTSA